MSDLVDLVIGKYDGSLKAEHGTGRNMAPFVKHEWGSKATDIMWRLKRLADPHGVLGPDVILTSDEEIHLKHFKSTPTIEKVANLCIECGFCEAVCPSRNVTTTPRQRIVLRREMARQPKDSPVLEQLQAEYEYDGIETCAADGTCAIPCPVRINTGDLIKGFRRAESTASRERAGLAAAKHWARHERLARTAMSAVDGIQSSVGAKVLTELSDAARFVVSGDLIPSVGRGRRTRCTGRPLSQPDAVFGVDGERPRQPHRHDAADDERRGHPHCIGSGPADREPGAPPRRATGVRVGVAPGRQSGTGGQGLVRAGSVGGRGRSRRTAHARDRARRDPERRIHRPRLGHGSSHRTTAHHSRGLGRSHVRDILA